MKHVARWTDRLLLAAKISDTLDSRVRLGGVQQVERGLVTGSPICHPVASRSQNKKAFNIALHLSYLC